MCYFFAENFRGFCNKEQNHDKNSFERGWVRVCMTFWMTDLFLELYKNRNGIPHIKVIQLLNYLNVHCAPLISKLKTLLRNYCIQSVANTVNGVDFTYKLIEHN